MTVFTDLPPELRAIADSRIEAYRRATNGKGLTAKELPAEASRVWACSEYVAQNCIRHPQLLHDLVTSGDLRRTYDPGEYRSKIEPRLDEVRSDEELIAALRLAKRREMVRIAWRDLCDEADFEATVADTSAFADAVLQLTLNRLHDWQVERLGCPTGTDELPQSLIVLALGKLGAEELNFSSDIDLIFSFPQSGQVMGRARSLSNEEFFIRLARRFIQVLSQQTEDGFVFRVDMRLRPFGASGPLVASANALEDYYQFHGRDWERYALIRARPVAGDIEAGLDLLEHLRPFVYRRYLDFGALESLRDMKSLIKAEVGRKDMQHDIKLGPGGIREVEFIGQAFQMVRGGRNPALRDRQILRVITKLGELSYLPPYAVRELTDAYRFLRTSEHRLQQYDDQQTHSLPSKPLERARLAAGMGFDRWQAYFDTLSKHRARVESHFDQVFGAPTDPAAAEPDALSALWEGTLATEPSIELLAQTGFTDGAAALEQIEHLRRAYSVRALGQRGRGRIARLMPVLLRAIGRRKEPLSTLERVAQVIESVARRSAYLALLIERPLGLSQLVRLCAASPMIARQFARHPMLLDELLDARALYAPLNREALAQDLKARLEQVPPGDTEHEMDCLRHFKQSNILRVAAADVSNSIALPIVSDHLTEIAEVTLEEILAIATRDLVARHGNPCFRDDGKRQVAPFAIVAYGKFGGLELGYGSDLDLVFLHGSRGCEQQTDGARTVDNSVFFVRLAQRIIHFLSTRTASGLLYETDARLRPSGSSGLLVTEVENFSQYQFQQAWTWEHQALVRARPVAGDAGLRRRFLEIRTAVLLKARDGESLRRDVVQMRNRMRTALDGTSEELFDLKQGAGGIADIEFMVQYGVLRWAAKLRNYLQFTDNARLLKGFIECGLMGRPDGSRLADAYRRLRERVHALALEERAAFAPAREFEDLRSGIIECWNGLMER